MRNFNNPYPFIDPYQPYQMLINRPFQVPFDVRSTVTPFNIPRGNPFSPTAKIATEAAKANRLSLNKVIASTQKSINTINQIIPIYQQVKPIIDNTKDFSKVIKRAFVRKKPETKIVEPKEKIEPEIVSPKKTNTNSNPFPNEEKNPNKPFF